MDAMRELDFPPHMRRELREQLEAYRELQKKNAAARAEAAQQSRERAKAARAAAAAAEAMNVEESSPAEEQGTESAPPMVPTEDSHEPLSADAALAPAATPDVPAAPSTELSPSI